MRRGGMMMFLTKELMMVPKTSPMMIPTAISSMLPLSANVLNFFSIVLLLLLTA